MNLIFGDFLDKLARINKTGSVADANTRTKLGALIFDGWARATAGVPDTDIDPPKRPGAGYRFHSGFSKYDLLTSAERSAGAGVQRSSRRRGRANAPRPPKLHTSSLAELPDLASLPIVVMEPSFS
ncbi:hypothetical protein DL546_008256 [Coniochaeta pulveracea]|uniref:Uncharacterized protein n=1 Tax=Coniochaeta pulveracea TaxID=177199 RepID=A0A420YG61_9PEZI|nr:hypothetical protein DL546_008256 [Coniochaeta pulveracea]